MSSKLFRIKTISKTPSAQYWYITLRPSVNPNSVMGFTLKIEGGSNFLMTLLEHVSGYRGQDTHIQTDGLELSEENNKLSTIIRVRMKLWNIVSSLIIDSGRFFNSIATASSKFDNVTIIFVLPT